MKVVSIVSMKGGAGKSTLSVNLAAEAQNRGVETMIVDLDPQASADSWGGLRDGAAPIVLPIPISRLSRTLTSAAIDGTGLVVIDTGAGITPATAPAVEAADIVLVPVRASIIDGMTVKQTLDTVRAASGATMKPVWVVLTCVPPRGQLGDEMQKAFETDGASVAPHRIGDRVLFKTSFGLGRGVVEMKPSDPASQEVVALWEWIKSELTL